MTKNDFNKYLAIFIIVVASLMLVACFMWPSTIHGASTINLTWTGTGDDGNEGTVDHYVLHWSLDSTAVYAGHGDTLVMIGNWHVGGTPETWSGVINFPSERTVFIAIRAWDNADLHGGMSNVVSRYIADQNPPGTIVNLTIQQ